MSLAGREMRLRGKELKGLRERAHRLFEENPEIKAKIVAGKLGVNESTAYSWKTRWEKRTGKKPPLIPQANKVNELTFEQLIKATGSIETLGVLCVEGFMQKLKESDDKIAELEEEKKKIMQSHNEYVARTKIGHVTIDQVEHRIIKKD